MDFRWILKYPVAILLRVRKIRNPLALLPNPPPHRMTSIPASMKALVLLQSPEPFTPGPATYHPVPVLDLAIPVPSSSSQILVKILSAAFNHRDLFLRQSLYPGLVFHTDSQTSIMGADAVGIVVSPGHALSGEHVLVAPAINWISSPVAPDAGPGKPFGILGSVKITGGRGTFAEYVVVGEGDVVKCPAHFVGRGREGLAEAASVPLGALTAWRAVVTKAEVQSGENVLITGIGGGVSCRTFSLLSLPFPGLDLE